MLDAERPEQPDFQHADLLALGGQIIHRFVHGIGAGTHDDDDLFGIRGADIIKQMILTADDLGEFVHRVLDDLRGGQIDIC